MPTKSRNNVLALFVTLPYGKMVHGVYRLAALVKFHSHA